MDGPDGAAPDRPTRARVPRGRSARILVIKPAGTVYGHDRVRLYQSVLDGEYGNNGDLMVYESTLRMLEYGWLETLDIRSLDERAIARANSEFDYAFVRGSNFIHEAMDWEAAPDILNKLAIPVFAIGVGAQSAERRPMHLSRDARRVWSAIAERSVAIGVRGAYSAEVLEANGVKNVEIIGCPTLFRARDPNLRLRLPPADGIRRVAFSLRRETGTDYARDIDRYLETQKRLILRLQSECDLTVTVHGEGEEKAFAMRDGARTLQASENLRQAGWFDPENEAVLSGIYRNRLHFYRTGEEYDAFLKAIDLAVGYRVHGVLPAMARGVPGILVDYDVRSAELAAAMDIPLVKEVDLRQAGLRDLYEPSGFDTWQRAFPGHYARMLDHLEKNGIPHRL